MAWRRSKATVNSAVRRSVGSSLKAVNTLSVLDIYSVIHRGRGAEPAADGAVFQANSIWSTLTGSPSSTGGMRATGATVVAGSLRPPALARDAAIFARRFALSHRVGDNQNSPPANARTAAAASVAMTSDLLFRFMLLTRAAGRFRSRRVLRVLGRHDVLDKSDRE